MVMFPDGGMSDGNGSMRPVEGGNFKARKVSVHRQWPYMCGPEYQHFSAEPEETAAVPGAVTGSGFQVQSDGAGTSVGLEVQEMESGEILGSPVEEQGNEAVDMMVERDLKAFVVDMDEEDSARRLKKTLPVRKVSVKRDFPKFCGLNAIEEDQNVGIESMDTRVGDNVVASSLEEDQETVKYCPRSHPTKVTAVSGGSMAVGSPVGVRDVDVDVRSKVRDVLRSYQTECRKLLHGEEARLEEGVQAKPKIRRIDLEAVKILRKRGKVVNTEPIHFIGSVPGVEVGDEFTYRAELTIVGIHRSYQGGIDFTTHQNGDKIAVSVVASGVYDDDLGDPNVLIYSGQGGNPGRGKEAEDQKLERGNLALWNSMRLKNPVRVVRGTKENDQESKSKISTKYVYDGLYTVEDQWKETGEHGKLVYMFRLIRMPNQPEVAWKEYMASKRTARVRHGVCIEDIAQKKELFPIGVVNTVDDERPPVFTYITKLVYPEALHLRPGRGCNCSGKCSDSKRCSCAWRNDGKIPYNINGALVETNAMVYECGPHCKCPPFCYNRVSQSGIKLPLEVFKTDGRGWGVRALCSIPSGSFICEYTGEILNQEEAGRRANDEYLFELGPKNSSDSDSGAETEERYTIDALRLGNVGRFINHSCSPNVVAQNVIYDHDDKKMPHIVFFAAENIPPLQELVLDYKYAVGQVYDLNGNQKVKECRCGAARCRGRLY